MLLWVCLTHVGTLQATASEVQPWGPAAAPQTPTVQDSGPDTIAWGLLELLAQQLATPAPAADREQDQRQALAAQAAELAAARQALHLLAQLLEQDGAAPSGAVEPAGMRPAVRNLAALSEQMGLRQAMQDIAAELQSHFASEAASTQQQVKPHPSCNCKNRCPPPLHMHRQPCPAYCQASISCYHCCTITANLAGLSSCQVTLYNFKQCVL